MSLGASLMMFLTASLSPLTSLHYCSQRVEGEQCPIHIDFFAQHVPSTMLVCLGVLIRKWVGGWVGADKADLWRSWSIVSEPTDVFFIEV